MRGNFRWYAAHCGKGHLYDEANTHVDKLGYQRCRRCDRDRHRRIDMIPRTRWRILDG
jgi:hypothetical protein